MTGRSKKKKFNTSKQLCRLGLQSFTIWLSAQFNQSTRPSVWISLEGSSYWVVDCNARFYFCSVLGSIFGTLTVNTGHVNTRGRGSSIHYLHGYVPPKRVLILNLLIQNGVSISEAFSRTGYKISNARKLHFCKQPFESIKGQIAFKNTVQCVHKQTVVLLLHPRKEYKKLAHSQNGVSVLGRILELGIKNWPIFRTGYQFQGNFFLERGANLESRAAHTHRKNTQVPPRGLRVQSLAGRQWRRLIPYHDIYFVTHSSK